TMARILYFLLLFILFVQVECKIKTLYCTSYDKDYGVFPICKLKPISRKVNSITVHYRQVSVVDKVLMRVEILKRANGWRPFLYDISVDMCDFLVKRNNPILNIAFSLLKPYLNTNYSCPLKPNETLFCDNLIWDLDKFRVRFPFETGEYGMRMSLFYRKVLKFTINGSAEYSNYREH
ncbi:hypothetical protein KR026_001550, partial [Drosophila bipectinata]